MSLNGNNMNVASTLMNVESTTRRGTVFKPSELANNGSNKDVGVSSSAGSNNLNTGVNNSNQTLGERNNSLIGQSGQRNENDGVLVDLSGDGVDQRGDGVDQRGDGVDHNGAHGGGGSCHDDDNESVPMNNNRVCCVCGDGDGGEKGATVNCSECPSVCHMRCFTETGPDGLVLCSDCATTHPRIQYADMFIGLEARMQCLRNEIGKIHNLLSTVVDRQPVAPSIPSATTTNATTCASDASQLSQSATINHLCNMVGTSTMTQGSATSISQSHMVDFRQQSQNPANVARQYLQQSQSMPQPTHQSSRPVAPQNYPQPVSMQNNTGQHNGNGVPPVHNYPRNNVSYSNNRMQGPSRPMVNSSVDDMLNFAPNQANQPGVGSSHQGNEPSQFDAFHSSPYNNPAGNYSTLPANWLFNQSSMDRRASMNLPPPVNINRFVLPQYGIRLSPEQIAARQVVPKDLPSFDGNPEDWPKFISNYQMTTEMCGFGNHENLPRLEKCLKGAAYAAVSGLLTVPATVPNAIELLRELYGNPDSIIDQMEEKLLALPSVVNDRLETLVEFSLAIQNHYYKLQGMGMENFQRNDRLVKALADKLPGHYRVEWSRHSMGMRSDLGSFSRWLFDLGRHAINMKKPTTKPVERFRPSSDHEKKTSRNFPKSRPILHVSEVATNNQKPTVPAARCFKCEKDHRLRDCEAFKRMNKMERWEFVRQKGICHRCFGSHHPRRCRSQQICGVDGCRMRHHPLMHYVSNPPRKPEAQTSAVPASTSSSAKTSEVVVAQIHCHARDEMSTLFRIVPVTLYGVSRNVDTFAFVDEGSSITLIDDDLAKELELEGPSENLCLGWTGDISRLEPLSQKVSVRISGLRSDCKYRLENVRTVKKLDLPIQSIDAKTTEAYDHLAGIPIHKYSGGKPRLLIGLDNYFVGAILEIREGKRNEPIAVRTRLGWTVFGPSCSPNPTVQRYLHIHSCNSDERLHELVGNYFSLENFGVSANAVMVESKDDKRSRELMSATTRYLGERYEVGLLWKHDLVALPNSYPMARRRLECLESKLLKDKNLSETINQKIADYIANGYARILKPHEIDDGPRVWYLPIFTVANPNKNKVRIVWDAAAKINGISLNSVLMKGPDQLKSLPGVLLRFRENPVAICGDIKEMFHQVRVVEADQSAQRFLWRNGDRSREPDVYTMMVMTFGACCSPCLAQHIKNHNARQFGSESPRAVHAIVDCHYVDDWLDSVDTEAEMIKLVSEVRCIHKRGGFDIRNFISNSRLVMREIGENSEASIKRICEFEAVNEKVLGLSWCPTNDFFTFDTNFRRIDPKLLNGERAPTKRELLQILMTLFDPLGFVAFLTVGGKILLQEVWRVGVEWDQPIPPEQNESWVTWTCRLRSLSNVHVPRCYPKMPRDGKIELHMFVDASMSAYAAVGYIRVQNGSEASCTIIAAKTKVAPQRPVSIPRLELLGAVLGARLARFIEAEQRVKFVRRVFWTDSQNVLNWISSDARKYKQFVALRISELLDLTSIKEWRWVPTAENVADDATKWQSSPELDPYCRWFQGPSFLRRSPNEWPEFVSRNESQVQPTLHHNVREYACLPRREHFSTLSQFIRVQAYTIRYIRNCLAKKRSQPLQFGPLTHQEKTDGEKFLIKECQREAFPREMANLQKNKPKKLDRDSPLLRYSPYCDEFGLIRMYGRIDQIDGIAHHTKRPIILPREHWVTRLVVEQYHRKFFHRNFETVVNELRQMYVIPQLRVLLGKVRRHCQVCKNRRPTTIQPQMGNLPVARLTPFTRPFSFTGLDYFGPIEVVVGRRVEKRWGALFTCMTVRAIHVEVAHSLTTDSCLMCIQRFISRRGTPIEIHSDHGTNFRGANRLLMEALVGVSTDLFEQKFPSIKWRFIPPLSPHMGGAWERLVRSVKSNLMEILPNKQRPNDEVLQTALVEVEFLVNSRPLTHVPIDADDDEALTPNHFLLGVSNGIRTSGLRDLEGRLLRAQWQVLQEIVNSFWKRWVREYLPTLTRRCKWVDSPAKQLEIGDCVVVVDEFAPRGTWVRGRIVDVNVSRDGQVRSAVVKTAAGVYTRPTVKLALLDLTPEPVKDVEVCKMSQAHLPGGGVTDSPTA